MDKKHIKAILLMGGKGERFGSDLPKQLHRLSGKPIYQHTLEKLLDSGLFGEIVLVCPIQYMETIKAEVCCHSTVKLQIVAGGKTRQESSLCGLLACGQETQIVLIHDAVRPFVSQDILQANVTGAITWHAVNTCIPSTDTLVYTPDKMVISTIPLRDTLQRGQTPQSFSYSLILQAHLIAQETGMNTFSDDCSLILANNHPVHIVPGSETNIKITSELDLVLAEQILRLESATVQQVSTEHSLRGKVFAITGGTGGIGQAIAGRLQEEGARPILIARSALEFPTDLTSFLATKQTFEKVFKTYGPVDGLINCVGLLKIQPFHNLSSDEIDLLLSTNLTSTVYSCRCAVLKENAHIINMASSSYTKGRKNYALYSSAKAAIVNFTQALAEEMPQMRVNAIVPERTCTAMRTHNFPQDRPHLLLHPQDVAHEVIQTLKQQTLTGAIISVKKKIFAD